VRLLLAQGRVLVDGVAVTRINQVVGQFAVVSLDGRVLQERRPVYLMLHKPVGVVSATKDDKHRTAIELLDHPCAADLHIAGRLDFNSSGLLLLTNDGEWSRGLTGPEQAMSKVYEVEVENPISDECIQAFATGMYFSLEGLTTRPARLEKIAD